MNENERRCEIALLRKYLESKALMLCVLCGEKGCIFMHILIYFFRAQTFSRSIRDESKPEQ
ncbi:MAG TPA: hypothetical protein VF354_07175, partial [Candidatus Methanoperedens sp.]